MNLLLTSSTVQQSTQVLNKRDGLNTVTVDDLFGVVEARNVRGRSPIIDKVRPMRYPRVC